MDETYIKLSDAKFAIMDYIGEQTVSKYPSEELCKASRMGAEGAMNELDYIKPADVVPRAAVEKLQEYYKLYFDREAVIKELQENIEHLQGKIDMYEIEIEAMRGAANSYKMHYEGVVREIFEDIQSCVVHRNWDEWRENILSFVVDAEKYAELRERYMKGNEGK